MSKIKKVIQRWLLQDEMKEYAANLEFESQDCACRCEQCIRGNCRGCTKGGTAFRCQKWSLAFATKAGKGVGIISCPLPDVILQRKAEEQQREQNVAWARIQAARNR
jgi:hypothetical protein